MQGKTWECFFRVPGQLALRLNVMNFSLPVHCTPPLSTREELEIPMTETPADKMHNKVAMASSYWRNHLPGGIIVVSRVLQESCDRTAFCMVLYPPGFITSWLHGSQMVHSYLQKNCLQVRL